jgi:rubrerythrin
MFKSIINGLFCLNFLLFFPSMLLAASIDSPNKLSEPAKLSTTAKPAASLDNLIAAFNGESNAQAKYLAFAKKADEEGYHKVAVLFRATAMAEGIHAKSHSAVIRSLGGTTSPTALETHRLGTTRENLENALKGETYEVDIMYPGFIQQAELEKNVKARRAFNGAKAVEGNHAKLFSAALANLPMWKAAANFYVCKVCGNTVEKTDFEFWPICKEPVSEYVRVQ